MQQLATFHQRRRALFLASAVIASFTLLPQAGWAAPIDPNNPPQGLFSDEWMALHVQGQKAGYLHTTMSRSGDQVTTRVIMFMSVARAGAPLEVSTMESYTESVTGQPAAFETTQKMATLDTRIRGQVRDGRVSIEHSQMGMTQKQEVAYPAGALMAWGVYREQVRRGMSEGLSYELDVYVPSLRTDQAVKNAVTVAGREKVELPSGTAEATRMTTTMSTPQGAFTLVNWVDDDWTALKSEIQMMGLSMVLLRCDKETATAGISAPELFVNTLVKVNRPIDRQAARRISYLLRVTGEGEPIPDLPETGMQKVRRRPDGAVEVDVQRQDHQALRQAPASAPSPDLAEYVEPNIWINSDDPEVVAMAQKAAGDAKTPYEIADRLREYVTEVIEEKNLNVGFASASEVCRNKEGDCSEHGVLLAALGRVHKIPTRVVMGLVYVPAFSGTPDVFGFHMWTQFHIGGQWVDFDAAQHESDCNPTHLAVATSSLKSAALAEMAFGLINIIGRLEIEVLEGDPPAAVEPK